MELSLKKKNAAFAPESDEDESTKAKTEALKNPQIGQNIAGKGIFAGGDGNWILKKSFRLNCRPCRAEETK